MKINVDCYDISQVFVFFKAIRKNLKITFNVCL